MKDKNKQKTQTRPAQKPEAPRCIEIIIIGDQVTIDDHSRCDDYEALVALLRAFGLEPMIKTESWCG
ncbi:hypothetical protein KJ969_03650 [Patescibacteria group bacterium]|nr:hypothetical protein [Patescibacteria group bacterium]